MAAAPTQASPAASDRTIPAQTDGGRILPARDPRIGAVAFSIDVAGADDVVVGAARLRADQAAWAAMPMAARIGVMQCWLGGVAKRADAIATDADDASSSGC
ncbi:hypothetical protein [Sphingobium sp. HWE2-09]|uniref:hypothetical protein n=1 Tax=Sphingobium sp. HWE2-09 TaxID=3108390 RepID=UPI002DC790F7|nr:hypothetical protein [Sphingobium sp. HWE2-09]